MGGAFFPSDYAAANRKAERRQRKKHCLQENPFLFYNGSAVLAEPLQVVGMRTNPVMQNGARAARPFKRIQTCEI
jgi:hypothetical protein